MCLICDYGADYDNINIYGNLYGRFTIIRIKNCNKITTIPIIEGIVLLLIENCPNVKEIPTIEGLQQLYIKHCENIHSIPIIKGLKVLQVENCPNVSTIPIITGLQELYIIKCMNITIIGIIEKLKYLIISDCKNINDIQTLYNNKYNTKEFNSIEKIKRWYKRLNFSQRLWIYAELVIIDSMNPHKENNKYLEHYINEKVYN